MKIVLPVHLHERKTRSPLDSPVNCQNQKTKTELVVDKNGTIDASLVELLNQMRIGLANLDIAKVPTPLIEHPNGGIGFVLSMYRTVVFLTFTGSMFSLKSGKQGEAVVVRLKMVLVCLRALQLHRFIFIIFIHTTFTFMGTSKIYQVFTLNNFVDMLGSSICMPKYFNYSHFECQIQLYF